MTSLFEKHRPILEAARRAISSREYWSAYSESPSPKVYGQEAKVQAEARFASILGRPFELPGHPESKRIGGEESPYGEEIGITYPADLPQALVAASNAARDVWAQATIEQRTGLCLEILHALNRESYLIAHACRITTGQPFVMAFQSGGPHAQERGLEAVAYAYEEMTRIPRRAVWRKAQGKGEPIALDKTFSIVPRGIGLVIACGTFPTWNSYPGLFASLVTGNAVIVKPHPNAILPLAITVQVMRRVLTQHGLDPNVVLLAADTPRHPVATEFAAHPDIGIIDFTGGPGFGAWLRNNVRHALVYTEEAGVNSIVIDGTSDYAGMCQNIALSLCLYSGQMCTAPQNIFVPLRGIESNEGPKSFDAVADGIKTAVEDLLRDPQRAEAILGCIQSPDTLARVAQAARQGVPLLEAKPVVPQNAPNARAITPLIRKVGSDDVAVFAQEMFGPISYIVATASTDEALRLVESIARRKGAITMGVHTTDPEVLTAMERAAMRAGVSLSCNFTKNAFINQNAAFSDFHVSGCNPSGNASLTDSAFVANRFRVVTVRRHPSTAALQAEA